MHQERKITWRRVVRWATGSTACLAAVLMLLSAFAFNAGLTSANVDRTRASAGRTLANTGRTWANADLPTANAGPSSVHGPSSVRGLPLVHGRDPAAVGDSIRRNDHTDGAPRRRVIHISVDGLRPDAIVRAGSARLPNLYRFRKEGAFTDNARTDYDYSVTLPNHMSQLTGRPVKGPQGHNWTENGNSNRTLHSNKGSYVASVFDVAHDNGLRTGAYVSKSKFDVLDRSYDARNGTPDRIGDDDGRDKIDAYVYDSDTGDLVDRFIDDMTDNPFDYAFLHLRDPDASGHLWGWSLRPGSSYMDAVENVDKLLGRIFEMIDSTPSPAGHIAIILTSDHGGTGHDHGDASNPLHYTIPLYVWSDAIPNQELYLLNADTRRSPRGGRPDFRADVQPIRNGDVANLALSYLGLENVPGSTINVATAALEIPFDGAAGADQHVASTAEGDRAPLDAAETQMVSPSK